MNTSLHLTFNISHFTLNLHFSFNNWQMVIDKLLKIDNCKLIIASEGGL